MTAGFTWIDGERLVRFGAGAREDAARLLEERGFDDWVLLTTERIAGEDPAEDRSAGLAETLSGAAATVLHVPAGRVDELSAQLLEEAGERPVVGLGGGRVIDTAKAIAGAREGGRAAAIPTTLAGSPMTPFHRTPKGVRDARFVRPELVVSDPELVVTLPHTELAATAMNALAHATESLYTPLANPLAELAALRAARLIGEALPSEEPGHEELMLAALLAGYAVGSAGLAIHHAVCQTIVRVAGTPHAQTNAVMLPHFARLMAPRAPDALGALAAALGDPVASPGAAGGLIARLAARSGHTRLSTLGVEEKHLPKVLKEVKGHRGLESTPDPPEADDLERLLKAAL